MIMKQSPEQTNPEYIKVEYLLIHIYKYFPNIAVNTN